MSIIDRLKKVYNTVEKFDSWLDKQNMLLFFVVCMVLGALLDLPYYALVSHGTTTWESDPAVFALCFATWILSWWIVGVGFLYPIMVCAERLLKRLKPAKEH